MCQLMQHQPGLSGCSFYMFYISQVVGDSWVTEVDVLPDGRRQPKSLSAKALKDVLQQRMGHVALRWRNMGGTSEGKQRGNH